MQDKLIKKLQENQENITKSLDALSDVVSQQGSYEGSTYGVNRWLSDLPSNFDPLETVEEIEDLDEDFNDDIFDNTDRVIKNTVSIQLWGKTQGFTLKEIKLKVNHLDGKRTSSNKVVKETAKKEQQSFNKYLEAVKGFEKGKKSVKTLSDNLVRKKIYTYH